AQLRRGGPDARIFVVDYNAEMIAAGREKGSQPEIAWAVGDAQRLPLPDASAQAYVIAFGIRNVTDIPAALREARRVLTPGGRFLGAVWALVGNDALLPRELDDRYPPSVGGLATTLRLLAGRGARQGRPGERLARSLEGMGPVAIKLGQVLSTRGDFFGREFA